MDIGTGLVGNTGHDESDAACCGRQQEGGGCDQARETGPVAVRVFQHGRGETTAGRCSCRIVTEL
jgi:hypothetical protein